MPVQWVNRPNLDFRGFSGSIVGGTLRSGDRVCVLPSGTQSTVARIVTMDGHLAEAVAGQAVTLTLTEEIDVSRGDVFCQADEPAEVADQFQAHIVWMSERPMLPGRGYLMKCGTRTVGFTGLSASGKSTIANSLENRLHALGVHTYLLDGDNLRHGLNKDLGFTDADRVENIRRVAEVAKLMIDAGLVVIASFISPFAVERQCRALHQSNQAIWPIMNSTPKTRRFAVRLLPGGQATRQVR